MVNAGGNVALDSRWLYMANSNGNGLHLKHNENSTWDWSRTRNGDKISVYLSFDSSPYENRKVLEALSRLEVIEQQKSQPNFGCKVYGEIVGISIVGYATDSDEFLAAGSVVGYTGPAGYGPQLLDPNKGYAIVFRSQQPKDFQGYDRCRQTFKYLKKKVTSVGLGYQPDPPCEGFDNGDEAIFVGTGWREGWTRQIVGGSTESNDTEPSAWHFVPSRKGPGLMRIEAAWGNKRQRYHLGAGAPESEENQNRGCNSDTRWHTSLIPLLNEEELKIPLSQQHVWNVVIDAALTKETGRRCWNIVYAGPNQRCVGWVLSFMQYEHEWTQLMNPDLTPNQRHDTNTGRQQYGSHAPSGFEIIECGYSADFRPPIRETVTSAKRHLVRFDLPVPAARTRSFADDADDHRWERELSKKELRTNGSPFYVTRSHICVNHSIDEVNDSCTYVDIGCRVQGALVQVHFCKGKDLSTSVRSYQMSSDLSFEVHHRKHEENPLKCVQYLETDNFWICQFSQGFPRGSESHCQISSRGIQNYRAPPPGGCIILALVKDRLGSKGGGKLGTAGIPKPLTKHRTKKTIEISMKMQSGSESCFSNIDTFRENYHFVGKPWVKERNNSYQLRDIRGWVEYCFVLPEESLVDIAIEYVHHSRHPLIMFLNGDCVDRKLGARSMAVKDEDQDPNCKGDSTIVAYSEVGPFKAKAGNNVVRFESTYHNRFPGVDNNSFPQCHKLIIDVVPLSEAREFRAPLSLSLRTSKLTGAISFVTTDQKARQNDKGEEQGGHEGQRDTTMNLDTAFRLLPDAFGVSGAVAFQPASSTSSNSLLGVASVAWRDPRSDFDISGGASGSGEDASGTKNATTKTTLSIASKILPDDGSAIWSGDIEKGDPRSAGVQWGGASNAKSGGRGSSSSGGGEGEGGGGSGGGGTSQSPAQDFVMKGLATGQPVGLQEVPSAVLRVLNQGGRNSKLEDCVSGIYLHGREVTTDQIQYIRFDYASGRSKSHGCYRGGDAGQAAFIGYYPIPYGTYLVQINLCVIPDFGRYYFYFYRRH